MQPRVSVQDLYNALRERLRLDWLAGREGGDRTLITINDESSSHHIAGALNLIHPNRIQVIGRAEHDYLAGLDDDNRRNTLERLFATRPAALFLTDGVSADADLIRLADTHGVPLFTTPLTDNRVLGNLQYYAALFLAEKKILHGVFLEVLGMGVLLTGEPAVGKSELALELISRGSRLVADDVPEFSRQAPDILNGSCPPLLRDFLEVRGLGLLNIRSMFGDSAIKRNKYLRLIVHLRRMSEQEIAGIDRLSGSYSTRDVLGVQIPQVTVPVAPGRNLAIMVEAAVRNHMLKLKGYSASEDFIARQQRAIDEGKKS